MVITTALWSERPRWWVKHLMREGSMCRDKWTLSIRPRCGLVDS